MKKYNKTLIIYFTKLNIPYLFEFTNIAKNFDCEQKISINPKGEYLNLYLTYKFNTFYKDKLIRKMIRNKILELEEQLKWRI